MQFKFPDRLTFYCHTSCACTCVQAAAKRAVECLNNVPNLEDMDMDGLRHDASLILGTAKHFLIHV